jgi:hypothetical protein
MDYGSSDNYVFSIWFDTESGDLPDDEGVLAHVKRALEALEAETGLRPISVEMTAAGWDKER